MKKKSIVLLFAVLLMAALFGTNNVHADTVDDAKSIIGGIAMYKMSEAGVGSVQEWADGAIRDGAGADSDAYAYALYKLGMADVSSYLGSLEKYLSENTVRSASTRLKYALCLCMKDAEHEYVKKTVDDSIGQLGIMSFVYGLHLANNGAVGTMYSPEQIALEILAMQHPDGGWSVMGQYGDVDVTAMVLQALAGIGSGSGSSKNTAVEIASKRAVRFLSEKQNADGGYSGFGNENSESTAQVLIALSSLGIDAASDPDFEKNGNSVIDGILKYRLPDGSFAHVEGGGSDSTATSQVFTAMASYVCSLENEKFYMVGSPKTKSLVGELKPVAAENAPKEDVLPGGSEDVTAEDGKSNASEDGTIAEVKSTGSEDGKTADGKNTGSEDGKTAGGKNTGSEDGTTADGKNTGSEDVKTADGKNTGSEDGTTVNEKNTDFESEDLNREKTEQNFGEVGQDAAEETAGEEQSSAEAAQGSAGSNIKGILLVSILGLAILASALLFALKKRNPKNFIFVLLVAIVAALIVFFSDFKTGSEYYTSDDGVQNAVGEVTVSIRCDTIAGLGDAEFIPEDGVILDTTTYAFEEGDSVYDILVRAVRENKIHMENKKTGSGPRDYYICGIANIYEYDWGDLSGWMYYVNGVSPSVGCGEYILKDGDRIEWLYTREIGRDLKGSMDMLTGKQPE